MKLSNYFFPRVVGLPTAPNAIEFNGGIPNLGGMVSVLNSLQQNSAAQSSGLGNYKSVSAAANFVFNAATVPGGIAGTIVLASGGAGVNGTLDATQNIVAAIPGAYVGQTALLVLANANTGTITMVVGDANTTLAGTTTCLTVAMRWYQIKVTNLAVPGAPGAAATNTTTTTAAVAGATATTTLTTTVIPVTASTGMIANASVLVVTNTDGTTFQGLVTAINTLNITVAGVNAKNVASGATVAVWNPAVTVTGMFALDKTTGVYA